ncbi:hypothetical protein T439DRAFT_337637 [Meredithblackwellia eburnea MCA 4105]
MYEAPAALVEKSFINAKDVVHMHVFCSEQQCLGVFSTMEEAGVHVLNVAQGLWHSDWNVGSHSRKLMSCTNTVGHHGTLLEKAVPAPSAGLTGRTGTIRNPEPPERAKSHQYLYLSGDEFQGPHGHVDGPVCDHVRTSHPEVWEAHTLAPAAFPKILKGRTLERKQDEGDQAKTIPNSSFTHARLNYNAFEPKPSRRRPEGKLESMLNR